MSELELLRWIRARLPRRNGRIVVDSGDDAAVLRLGRGLAVFKIDSVLEGVHFDRRTARPEDIGHKAMARPLSDVAAMGAVPAFALAAMMIPREMEESEVRRVILGMERTARRFGVAIVGGDVASHAGGLALSVALLGEVRGGPPLRRSGARPGDALAVTGALGGSLLGKHLRFVPRVREAQEIRRRFRVRAMIDLSDGLLRDLGHLCEAGGVGAALEEARIPISAAARTMARRDGRSPLDHALADGEDYELLFALPAEEGPALERARLGRVIGRVERRPGLRLARRDGREEVLEARGWEHRFGS
ncbi:MAG TPA: thiamine-phosphate kinase [Planctomycetota bacterium]|nr:thiamine-phosphate kinase [Planctomycetota bacterium]